MIRLVRLGAGLPVLLMAFGLSFLWKRPAVHLYRAACRIAGQKADVELLG